MRVDQLSLQVRIDRVLPEHSHPVHELHYVVEGRAAFEHRGDLVQVAPGDLFYTLPGQRHRMHGRGGGPACSSTWPCSRRMASWTRPCGTGRR